MEDTQKMVPYPPVVFKPGDIVVGMDGDPWNWCPHFHRFLRAEDRGNPWTVYVDIEDPVWTMMGSVDCRSMRLVHDVEGAMQYVRERAELLEKVRAGLATQEVEVYAFMQRRDEFIKGQIQEAERRYVEAGGVLCTDP